MSKDPAVLFYTSDFITGTMFMSNEEVGIYVRLLCAQHQHGGLLDKGSFNALVGDHALVRNKFIETDDGFFNKRMMEEMDKRKVKSCNLSANAKIRWDKHNKSNANAMQKDMPTEDENEDEDENKDVYDFDVLWQRYPRKLGKHQAQRHFKAQVKTDQDYSSITTALENFLLADEAKGDIKFIPHGSTWFNERWRDWVDIANATGKSQALVDLERMTNAKR